MHGHPSNRGLSDAAGSDSLGSNSAHADPGPPSTVRPTLRIFVSSPGDLTEERLICREVIQELAPEFLHLAALEPVLWEELPLTAEQAFQDQLPLPAECQVVIIMLWSRLGSRLHSRYKRAEETEAPTGTLFEFRNALAARQENGNLPDILVYRKIATPPAPSLTDEAAWRRARTDLQEVDRFFETTFRDTGDGAFIGAYHTFRDLAELRDRLKGHLRRLLQSQLIGSGARASGVVSWLWPISQRGSPFRGLKAFEPEHAAVFFGRTEAAATVRRTLVTQAAQGKPFVLITGASGLGKSSLARAGVIPKLTEPGAVPGISFWRTAIVGPKLGSSSGGSSLPSSKVNPLLFELAEALMGALPAAAGISGESLTASAELARSWCGQPAVAVGKVETGLAVVATEARLLERTKLEKKVNELETAGDYEQAKELRTQSARILAPQGRLVLLVDQLEEIFTAPNITEQHREQFVAVLDALARSGAVWIIATLRSDFLGRLSELPLLIRLLEGGGEYRLLPPTREELGQMIRAPALSAGLRFEERAKTRTGLDTLLRDEALDDPMALPLLEFALEELFHRRELLPDGGGRLTIRAYAQIRKLRGAIGRQAERVYSSLEASQHDAFSHVMRGVVTLNFADEGEVTLTRRWTRYDHLTATTGAKALVDAFIAARLFIADQETNPNNESGGTVSVAHEALFSSWPRLKHWLTSEREFLKSRARLENDLRRWQEEGKSAGYLLDGKRMADAKALLEEHRADLTADQINYIQRSQAAAESMVKRRVRRLQAAVALFATLAAGAGLLAWFAWNAQQRAVTETARASYTRNEAEKLVQFMLFDLKQKLEPVGKLDLMSGLNDRVEDFYKALSGEAGDRDSLRNQAAALDSIGDVRAAQGNLAGARDAYQKAFEVWQRLTASEPGNIEWQRGLSMAWQKLGDVQVKNGDLAAALQMYQKGLEITEHLSRKAGGTPDLLRDLFTSWEKIGWVRFNQSNVTGALEAFRKGVEIAEPLANDDRGDTAWQRNLAMGCERMGEVLARQGDLSGAAEAHQKQLAICQRLLQREPDNTIFQRDVSLAWLHVGEDRERQSDPNGALEAYQKSLQIMQRLAERDPANIEWQRDLAIDQDSIGDVYFSKGQFGEAQAAYEASLPLWQQLAQHDPSNSECQRDLSLSWGNIGQVREEQNDLSGALEAYQKAFEIKQKLVRQDAGNRLWQRDLSLSWNEIGEIRFKQNDFAAALEAYQKGLDIRNLLFKRDENSIDAQADIAVSELLVGKTLVSLGRKEEGRTSLETAKKRLSKIKDQAQLTSDWKEDLAKIESELAKLDKR